MMRARWANACGVDGDDATRLNSASCSGASWISVAEGPDMGAWWNE